MTFLGHFLCKVKDIIFAWRGAHKVRLNPCEVRLKRTTEMEGGREIAMNIGIPGTWVAQVW